MEPGGESSNPQKRRNIRSQNAGVVIREAGDANIANDAANNDENPRQTHQRTPDQYLPLSNLTRIMRTILPPHAKIADGAKETMQECVSEFINFVTAEAKERCHREQRKIITAEDLLSAMGALGFTNYVEPLTLFLNKDRMQDAGPLVGRPVRFVQPYAQAPNAQPSRPMQAQPSAPMELAQNAAFATAQEFWPPAFVPNVAPQYVMPAEQGGYYVQMGERDHDGRGGEISSDARRGGGSGGGGGGGGGGGASSSGKKGGSSS